MIYCFILPTWNEVFLLLLSYLLKDINTWITRHAAFHKGVDIPHLWNQIQFVTRNIIFEDDISVI